MSNKVKLKKVSIIKSYIITYKSQTWFLKKEMQGGIPTIIPQQILQLRQIFGVNTTLPKSIALLPSDRLFYIAGYYGVVYNPK